MLLMSANIEPETTHMRRMQPMDGQFSVAAARLDIAISAAEEVNNAMIHEMKKFTDAVSTWQASIAIAENNAQVHQMHHDAAKATERLEQHRIACRAPKFIPDPDNPKDMKYRRLLDKRNASTARRREKQNRMRLS